MPERPPITTTGVVLAELAADRLYRVIVPSNRHEVMGVREKHLPTAPVGADPAGLRVTLGFSPFDMSRAEILAWHEREPADTPPGAPGFSGPPPDAPPDPR